jgi:hypothetical protein
VNACDQYCKIQTVKIENANIEQTKNKLSMLTYMSVKRQRTLFCHLSGGREEEIRDKNYSKVSCDKPLFE